MDAKEFLYNIDFHNKKMPINNVGIDKEEWTSKQVEWMLEKYFKLKLLSLGVVGNCTACGVKIDDNTRLCEVCYCKGKDAYTV